MKNFKSIVEFYLSESIKEKISVDDEKKIMVKAKAKDNKAIYELLRHNIVFIYLIAKKYVDDRNSIDDLMQEGIMAFVEMIDKYDMNSNNRFFTYAKYYVEVKISNYKMEKALMKKDLTFKRKLLKLNKVKQELYVKLNKEPSKEELLSKLSIKENELNMLLSLKKSVFSLNSLVLDNSDTEFEDLLSSDAQSFIENIENEEVLRVVQSSLLKLNYREREIIKMMYGFYHKVYEISEIAKIFNVTPQRIRQVRDKALLKLKEDKNLKELVGMKCEPELVNHPMFIYKGIKK